MRQFKKLIFQLYDKVNKIQKPKLIKNTKLEHFFSQNVKKLRQILKEQKIFGHNNSKKIKLISMRDIWNVFFLVVHFEKE